MQIKPNKQRKQKRKRMPDYSPLEPRQLLASVQSTPVSGDVIEYQYHHSLDELPGSFSALYNSSKQVEAFTNSSGVVQIEIDFDNLFHGNAVPIAFFEGSQRDVNIKIDFKASEATGNNRKDVEFYQRILDGNANKIGSTLDSEDFSHNGYVISTKAAKGGMNIQTAPAGESKRVTGLVYKDGQSNLQRFHPLFGFYNLPNLTYENARLEANIGSLINGKIHLPQGAFISLLGNVHNHGSSVASSSVLHSEITGPGGTRFVASTSTLALQANAQTPIPSNSHQFDTSELAPGEYTFNFTIDANNSVGERDEVSRDSHPFSFEHDPNTYTSNNTALSEHTNSFKFVVTQRNPTSLPGGPYTVAEGGSVQLFGNGSDPIDSSDELTYRWDLDNNGSFETPGRNPVFSAAGLDGPSVANIALQVTNTSGNSDVSSTQVSIFNVAPTAEAGGPYSAARGRLVQLFGSGTDPSAADASQLNYQWDLDGDGVFGESGTQAERGNENLQSPWYDSFGLENAGTQTVTLRVSDKDGAFDEDFAQIFLHDATVEARYLFYNDSHYDNDNPGANSADFGAIDTSKSPLLPGGIATFSNYTGFKNGINGIFVDVDGLGNATPHHSDFQFATGNDNEPDSWPALPHVPQISVYPGAGENGSDRIGFTWPNESIVDTWLQVTVLNDGPNRIVSETDTFYFGNSVGEVGAGDTRVNSVDLGAVMFNFSSFGSPPEAISNPYDLDKSGHVTSTDAGIVSANFTGFFETPLQLIDLSESSGMGITWGGFDSPPPSASRFSTFLNKVGQTRDKRISPPQGSNQPLKDLATFEDQDGSDKSISNLLDDLFANSNEQADDLFAEFEPDFVYRLLKVIKQR